MSTQTFVIVGGGLAGAKAAEALREEGFDGRVVLLGEEDVAPYERPPLSKEYLQGEAQRDVIWAEDEGWYEAHDVQLRTSTKVSELALSSSEVVLDGGERIGFDQLLLATGSSAKRLPIPGADLDGVRVLRTVHDSDALREALQPGVHVAVIGAGWIGCEVAASARKRGAEVTMIAPEEFPLERVLGPEVGAIYREVHASHGVELALGTGVEAIEGSGKVSGVRTSAGTIHAADLVVIGVGAAPRLELAEAAGLDVDGGVLTDDRLRTSAANVFAAGDIAAAEHPIIGERIRVEHWGTALEQGPAAARNMLGRDLAYDRIPYFFSDQYDVGMEYAGYAPAYDRVVFRGEPSSFEFLAFWMRGNRVVAGMNVNVWEVNDDIQALIRSGCSVEEDALRDPDVALGALAVA
jgi:3-phenylpropionate/trans-cinnamate dioxygenase ferredoxin reductase subunit